MRHWPHEEEYLDIWLQPRSVQLGSKQGENQSMFCATTAENIIH